MKQTQIRMTLLMPVVIAALFPILAFAGTSGPSPIPPAPGFQVSTNTLALCKGVTNNIPITVSNLGNDYYPSMQNVQLSLSSQYILQTGRNSSMTINSIAPGTSGTATAHAFINMSSSPLITVKVPISYTYLTLYNDTEIRNLTFETIYCPSLLPLSINVTPDVIVSGQINNLTLGFTNTGNTTLSNISAQISISGSQSGVQLVGKKPLSIGSISPGNTVNITQRIFENGSQMFPLNVTAAFFNGTNLDQVSDSFTMLSGGVINLVPSSISVTPTSITPGSIFSISFIITDTGTTGVSNANASAVLPNGFTNYGVSTYDYIGNIGVQSPTAVSIALVSNSSLKSGSYIIPIKLNYMGNFRQKDSITVNITVNVTGSGSGTKNYGTGTPSSTGSNGSAGNAGAYVLVGTFIAVVILIFAVPVLLRRRQAARKKGPVI